MNTLTTLIKYADHASVLSAIENFAEKHPVFAFNQLLTHHKQVAIKRLLLALLNKHADWQARLLSVCDTDALPILQKLTEQQVHTQDASDDLLPEIFINPPWQKQTGKIKGKGQTKNIQAKHAQITLNPITPPPVIHWQGDARQQKHDSSFSDSSLSYDHFESRIMDRIPKQVARKTFKDTLFAK